jgi:hypothetical protein
MASHSIKPQQSIEASAVMRASTKYYSLEHKNRRAKTHKGQFVIQPKPARKGARSTFTKGGAKGHRISVNIHYNIPGTEYHIKRVSRPVEPIDAKKGLKIPGTEEQYLSNG